MLPLIDKTSSKPIFEQVSVFYKTQILQKRITSGMRLPSVRKLAADLALSNNTIIRAYDQLLQEGYVYNAPRKGLFAENLEKFYIQTQTPSENKSAESTKKIKFNFRQAQIDQQNFPLKAWRKMNQVALDGLHYQFLNFEESAGLKEELTRYLFASRGVKASADRVIICSGTNISILILCHLFRKKIKQVIVEDPGYAEGRDIFQDAGFKIFPIGVTKQGLDINKLPATKNNLLYVTPSHQYPTGAVMPVHKRIRLIQWAVKTDSYILEDDYDSEFRYRGTPIPSLQAIDQFERVIYASTFSKVLMPSLRVAYFVLPEKLQTNESFEYLKCCVGHPIQKTLALFMQEGLWERHLRKARKIYKQKYYETASLIKKILGDHIHINTTHAGLYFVLTLRKKANESVLMKKAADAGLRMVSTENCYYVKSRIETPSFFFGFADLEMEEVKEALTLLKKTWFNK